MSVAAFDGAPERGTINFSVGQPSADLLPLALLRGACERFFAGAQPLELNYGERQGDPRFRAALAGLLSNAGGGEASPQSLMLTGGVSQALDFVCSRFTRPGDTVFVEEPSYVYSFQIFRDHGLKIVGIPLDGQGLDIEQCELKLAEHRPKLLYTIPAYNNPTGQTLSQERRERLVALSRKHGFIIAADEVYQLLHHGAPPPASFGTLVDRSQRLAETGLGNQVRETIALVRSARGLGAAAASAFGAGFGGSVWALVASNEADEFLERWAIEYRREFPERTAGATFFTTRPGAATSEV